MCGGGDLLPWFWSTALQPRQVFFLVMNLAIRPEPPEDDTIVLQRVWLPSVVCVCGCIIICTLKKNVGWKSIAEHNQAANRPDLEAFDSVCLGN